MKTRKYVPLIFLLFCSIVLQAQKQVVPGYQGKRFMAGLYYNFMSASAGYNSNGKSVDGDIRDAAPKTELFAFSGRFEANVSYVLSRRFTGTFEIGHGKTGLTRLTSIQPNSGWSSYSSTGFYKVGYSYAAIGVQMQRTKRWGLAPIGPYWGIRYIATKNHLPSLALVELNAGEYVSPNNCDCSVTEVVEDFTGETILKSKIYHNFDVQFGIKNIIKQYYFYDFAVSTSPTGYYASDGSNRNTFDTRLKRLLSINLRLGVGILF